LTAPSVGRSSLKRYGRSERRSRFTTTTFSPDAKDEDWLLEVGKRSWIVLTKDDRIRYRVTERTAIATARVRAFVLTSTQLQETEMAAAFVKALPRIKRLVTSRARLHSLLGFQEREKSRCCEADD
jgi:hypothetical protein